MATWHDHFTEEQADLIKQSSLFFIATVDPGLQAGPNGEGVINMSPKGGVPLIVVGPNKVAYLDSAGSGNETARHTDNGSPTTIMVCSFEKENAGNVRLFGHGMAVPFEESSLSEKVLKHQATDLNLPQPEVIEIDVAKT